MFAREAQPDIAPVIAEADVQPLAGLYRVKYAVLGLRYSIKEFRRLVYVEARFDSSRDADGTQIGDSVALGVRWDFD